MNSFENSSPNTSIVIQQNNNSNNAASAKTTINDNQNNTKNNYAKQTIGAPFLGYSSHEEEEHEADEDLISPPGGAHDDTFSAPNDRHNPVEIIRQVRPYKNTNNNSNNHNKNTTTTNNSIKRSSGGKYNAVALALEYEATTGGVGGDGMTNNIDREKSGLLAPPCERRSSSKSTTSDVTANEADDEVTERKLPPSPLHHQQSHQNPRHLLDFNVSHRQQHPHLLSEATDDGGTTSRQGGGAATTASTQQIGSTGTATSSHASSSQHHDKAIQIHRLLSALPSKDRDEMLLGKGQEARDNDDDDDSSTRSSYAVGPKRRRSSAVTAMLDDDDDDDDDDNDKHLKKKGNNNNNSNTTKKAAKLETVCDELEDFAGDAEKNKRFFEEMLDQPFTGVVVIQSSSQTIVYVNSFACFMFNRVEADLVGHDVSILMGQVPGREDNKVFHHQKISNFLSNWSRKGAMPDTKIASGRVQEVICTRFEGIKRIPFTAQMVVRPVKMTQQDEKSPPAAFVGFFRDYTAEKSLKASLAQTSFTLSLSSEPMIVMDAHGTIREINKAACKMFGYSEKFLIKTEANIKLLMPEATAREHDRYLKTFREKLRTPGFDIKTSPIINKERALTGRRSDGVEIPIELRVDLHLDQTRSGNDRLIGYIRDRSALIKSADFNLEVSKRLFPESIAKKVAVKSDLRLVETYKNMPVIMIDLVDFVTVMQGLDNEGTFEYLDTFFNQVADIASNFQVEIIKTNADGVIAVCGLDEFDDRRTRLDRIVSFGLEVLGWCEQNSRRVRIGVGVGDLGSALFEVTKGRPTYDIWSSAINFASRCEKHADPQTIQITPESFRQLSDPSLTRLFQKKVYKDGIKGMQDDGEGISLYQTRSELVFDAVLKETERIKAASLSRLFLKRENARQLKEQQDRRALTQGT